MDYNELLDKAYDKLSKVKKSDNRFEVPKIESSIQGNQTIIRNFKAVTQAIRREPKHLLKFLSKELAAPGNFDGNRAILQTKIPARNLEAKLDAYIKEYVFCNECKRPDTKLVKEGRITLMVCEACGAKATVRTI